MCVFQLLDHVRRHGMNRSAQQRMGLNYTDWSTPLGGGDEYHSMFRVKHLFSRHKNEKSMKFPSENINTLLCMLFMAMAPLAWGQACSDESACNYQPDAGPFCLDTEVVQVHEEGELAGMTTYRLYFLTDTATDLVSAVFGDSEFPLSITTTTSFYQDALGAANPNSINTLLFAAFPNLEFDSWVTIGIDQVPNAQNGEGGVELVSDVDQPWSISFENGGDIIIDSSIGGAWFSTNNQTNGAPDDQGRVLLGQFTTDGELGGMINVSVFPAGQLGGSGELGTYAVGEVCECTYPQTYYLDADGDGYGTESVTLCDPGPGYATQGGDCNDNTALAFPGNPLDIIGDGIDGDCDGAESCYRDVDNDGYRLADSVDVIGSPFNLDCAEFGEAYFYQPIDCDDTNPLLTVPDEDGNCQVDPPSAAELCADPEACNYNLEALPEEDNCEYVSCQGCSNAGACNYNPLALIQTELICEYLSCAGCSDPEATNYNPAVIISNESVCIYSGLLAIAPVTVHFEDNAGPAMNYTNEVYALLPPNAIRLKRIIGVKGGSVTLNIQPFDAFYQSATCDVWQPLDMSATTEVGGVEFTNLDCLSDSWFTIGGGVGTGPELVPFGFDPANLSTMGDFDSEQLMAEGDSLGWEIAGDVGGEPMNYCEELFNRPGCANAVRIARVTMALGQSFSFQAGLTYTVAGTGERSVTGLDITDDTSTVSDSGGGGEADSDDAVISDGISNNIYGCIDSGACNYDGSATVDSGDCDYDSCTGCTYPDAENYEGTASQDDGTCVFSIVSGCPFDTTGDGLIGAADLVDFLSQFDTTCP